MLRNNDLLIRAEADANNRGIEIIRQPILGHGSDGAVWRTSEDTAVKVLWEQYKYIKEVTCYQRFKAASIRHIGMFAVPFLEGFDDDLLAIEMTIVEAPYLLDFGKVSIDEKPPYYGDSQLMANTFAEWRSLFGKNWKHVGSAMETLRHQFGIYYSDPRPSNISMGNDDNDDDWWRDAPALPEDE